VIGWLLRHLAEFLRPGQEGSKLSKTIMGTGPYMLNHWTPESEWVLDANPNYWRTADNPIWDGGPSGVAKVQHIVHKTVPEWGTRFAMLQTGDVAMADVQLANYTQVDPWLVKPAITLPRYANPPPILTGRCANIQTWPSQTGQIFS